MDKQLNEVEDVTPLETEEVATEIEIPGLVPGEEDIDQFQKQKNWLKEQVWTKPFRKHWGLKLPQYKRDEPRVGRNDICPCGSGMKYKKCCINGKREREPEQLAS